MGILQSLMKTDDEEENVIASQSEYARTENFLASPQQWQNGNHSTRSHQSKYSTISVPELGGSSSHAYTSVNDKVKKSAACVKENGQSNVCGGERTNRTRRDEVPVMVKCRAAAEDRWIKHYSSCHRILLVGEVPVMVKCRAAAEDRWIKHYSSCHRILLVGEVPVMVKCRAAAAAEDRWIKHYSSCHQILLVGEGDFSFSTCLASAFGKASNMVATSLDSPGFLVKNYGSAFSNLVELSLRKCRVMHDIDATQMASHPLLGGIKFDRIIFNFPFAGFFKELPRDAHLRRHRTLVSRFLENAKQMLSKNGEIHITHKTNGFHKEWKVEGVASLHGLKLVEAVEFNKVEYPGYNTKYGFGGDNNFNCNPSMTYKFQL